MAWRLARSLETLRSEIWSLHPGTTVWTIGDPAHASTWSDHNPNSAGVVCAADVLGDKGLSLRWFADTIVRVDPPALKYVIYNREIWFPQTGWQPYFGSNPHTTHVHVSVGWGPDGRSTGPYDDTSPWGIAEESDMPLDKDDVKRIFTTDGILDAPNTWKETNPSEDPYWTLNTYMMSIRDNIIFGRRDAAQHATKTAAEVSTLRGEVAGLTALVQQLIGAPPVDLTPEQFQALLTAVKEAAAGPGNEFLARLAAAGDALDGGE